MRTKLFIIVFIVVAVGVSLVYILIAMPAFIFGPGSPINNFDDCAAQGFPIMESYPRQCKVADGETFTEDIGNECEKTDLIKISNPRPNQTIGNPILINGEARGFWFFEASFPVKIFDENDFLLGIVPAQALGEWMTEDFVPFSATLSFSAPSTQKGKLVLEKDNPSGLPEHSDQLIVPVYFEEISGTVKELMTARM